MENVITFNTLLVPTDFSESSQAAFRQAVALASGESAAVILLHVVDSALVESAVAHALAEREDVVRRMRERAAELLKESMRAVQSAVEVDTLVSEGVPFLEILQKADDFAVDAIIMGKVGTRGSVEHLLFGSTAEKVVRASNRPVLTLPIVRPTTVVEPTPPGSEQSL